MEKFEIHFLKDKYWNNEEFRKATAISASQTKKRIGESAPDMPHERIENYFNRFSEVTGRGDPMRREIDLPQF